MIYMNGKKTTTSIKITIEAKKDLDSLVKETGMLHQELVSRSMNWIYRQKETLRSIILGQISTEHEIQIYELLLKDASSKLGAHHYGGKQPPISPRGKRKKGQGA